MSVFPSRIDSDVFDVWLSQDLLPKVNKGTVMVMDHATFHKRYDILKTIENGGCIVEFLPRYRLDLNPIGKKWTQAKSIRRKLRVWSRPELVWIECKSIRIICPDGADIFEWRKLLQDLQATGVSVSGNEFFEMREISGKAKKVITCPYHAWAYALDGKLVHATNCENVPGFEMESFKLTPFHVIEHAGFIFVNLSTGEPRPIEEQLPGFAAKLNGTCPVIKDLKLAARFVNDTRANWKNIVDNYIECYHCPTCHVSFASSVDVNVYEHQLHDNWTIQIGQAKSSEASFSFDSTVTDPKFFGFWTWPGTMFNVPPGGDFMTVIYEFPVSAARTLQHYEIYFLNEDLSDYQKKLIEWYRDTFRPEDLRLVESVQRGLNSRGYPGQARIMTDRRGGGLSEHALAHFQKIVAKFHLGLGYRAQQPPEHRTIESLSSVE